jgi:hypothetical protein
MDVFAVKEKTIHENGLDYSFVGFEVKLKR